MRTVKWNPFLSGGCALLGAMLLWAGAARADVSSTNAAAIVVFPKILVDTTTSTTTRTDTLIQLTNTSADPVNVRCFYVNANGHCSNDATIVCDPAASPADTATVCGSSISFCQPSWQENDFAFTLTSKQPISWLASEGLLDLPVQIPTTGGQTNSGSILPVGENPFRGELKCIEVGDSELPIDKNDLKGEATIETVSSTMATDGASVDVRSYNAVGIQAIAGAQDGPDGHTGDDTLLIGQEYNPCPNILVLDHYFDDVEFHTDVFNSTVRTHLTLVPCSEDFNLQAPITTTVQYLVFNEFEQRFSTSKPVTCFSERVISDIDTRPGDDHDNDAKSMFNVGFEGTLVGQTLIRGVADSSTTTGHGLLGVAEEFWTKDGGGQFSDAFSLNQRGTRTQLDVINLPAASPPNP